MLIDIPISNNSIDFCPDNELKEIIQNVITICTTLKGSVPLDRELGIDAELIDAPVNVSRAKISAQFIQAVKRFEPRADISRVTFKTSGQEVIPVVTIKANT